MNPRRINWTDLEQSLNEIAWPKVDRVVAIARGGLVFGAWLAGRLRVPLNIVDLRWYEDGPSPKTLSPKPQRADGLTISNTKDHILLVDDVVRTGTTLNEARALFPKANIHTATLYGTADFTLGRFEDCLIFPWTPLTTPNEHL